MRVMNEMRVDFMATSKNESFARVVISAFVLELNPTLEEVDDIKTAVSEAVTNAIVHGYEEKPGTVRLEGRIFEDRTLEVIVRDAGCGIADVAQARQPFYTSKPDMERSGMGFSVMETFMDGLIVSSTVGHGTTVRMLKKFSSADNS